jgi:cell division protein FtsZ
MVKPGLVNCDFADVETIMKGMGKAMMGTGEAEGENRAEEATNAALYNPLIDEYSLKGAKGLLLNVTGGSDLTLFEVDYISNKIRAEVDSEAEIIFGSIEDENLNRKIRVSIVATSLDAQEPQIKPVISMVHRLHNRNTGYSDSFVSTLAGNQTAIKATEGATALNLDNVVDENKIIQQRSEQEEIKKKSAINSAFENISMENAAYLQNTENVFDNQDSKSDNKLLNFEVDSIELATPELFSDKGEENSFNQDNNESELEIFESSKSKEETEIKEPEMFEETNLEEDFEIPAFLRRQKN